MSEHRHVRRICEVCGAVILQCRCIGPKLVEYGRCAEHPKT